MDVATRRGFLTALALVVMLLPVCGCKFMSMFGRSAEANGPSLETAPSSVPAIKEMPRVTFKDLDATGRKLTAAGLTVMVKRESFVVTPGKKATKAFTVSEIVRPFTPSQWNHMIAAQDPPPGTTLRPGAMITLTAGIHHGAGPFGRWLDNHGMSVSIRGEQRCRDCHTESYCSECHEKAGKDK